MTQSNKNKAIIACAGGRKTTLIVEEALKIKDLPVLITTYTLENLDQINTYITEKNGFIPKNITTTSWFTFLLHDCIRPYQNMVFDQCLRIESIDFISTPPIGLKKNDYRYYINRSGGLYQDRASDFAYKCNEATGGLMVQRLEKIYKYVFIDEAQDLAGWDLDIVKSIMTSQISTFLVADPRQATYSTNGSNKNKGLHGKNMADWINEQEKAGLCTKEEIITTYRSHSKICEFADLLYPEYPKTLSQNAATSDHDGVFAMSKENLNQYIELYEPIGLRFSILTNTFGNKAINIGLSKGRSYIRVLIYPTKPMKQFLFTGDISQAGMLSKLYVAITRARQSVIFVLDPNEIPKVKNGLLGVFQFTH
jgi:hypothetical protein